MSYTKTQERIHEVIFEADTPAGKAFDVALLICIIISILATMLETVDSIRAEYGDTLLVIEWVLTILFTIEYILRIYSSRNRLNYIFSFYGIVDFLSIFPTYLGIFSPRTRYWAVIRSLRLLRVFRVLKMGNLLTEYESLNNAVKRSRNKILVFLTIVLIIVFIVGSFMYVIEQDNGSGFDNIPVSVYWAIVTVTTVGYGDIAPVTALGQLFAALLMIVGYAIIAVPTGIVGSEMIQTSNENKEVSTQVCSNCMKEGHKPGAKYCYSCGSKL